VTGADWVEGVVLRYGAFYGPGTSFAVDPPGSLVEVIRKRMLKTSRDDQHTARNRRSSAFLSGTNSAWGTEPNKSEVGLVTPT
jgi:hypothetical protein